MNKHNDCFMRMSTATGLPKAIIQFRCGWKELGFCARPLYCATSSSGAGSGKAVGSCVYGDHCAELLEAPVYDACVHGCCHDSLLSHELCNHQLSHDWSQSELAAASSRTGSCASSRSWRHCSASARRSSSRAACLRIHHGVCRHALGAMALPWHARYGLALPHNPHTPTGKPKGLCSRIALSHAMTWCKDCGRMQNRQRVKEMQSFNDSHIK